MPVGACWCVVGQVKNREAICQLLPCTGGSAIGLSGTELAEIGGQDAGAVARALVAKSTLTVWQYAVHKASNGDLEQAPLRKVGLIAHDSLRIEPFATPIKVLPHA